MSSKPPQKPISPNSSRSSKTLSKDTVDRNPAQIQWQKAIDAINTQDSATIEQQKANISKLITTLNADDDIGKHWQIFN
jgi:hypothetical protein